MKAKDIPGQPGFPGERHGVFLDGPQKGFRAAFLGPGTHVAERVARGDRPANAIDALARTHDLAYLRAGERWQGSPQTAADRAELHREIDLSDAEFIRDIGLAPAKAAGPITAAIARRAMQLKSLGERLDIIPRSVFSGEGRNAREEGAASRTHTAPRGGVSPEVVEKLFYPDHALRRKKAQALRGGFLPKLQDLPPVAQWFLGAFDEGVLGAIMQAARKKMGGSGFAGPDADRVVSDVGARPTPHGRAAAVLSLLPQGAVLEILAKVIGRSLRAGKNPFVGVAKQLTP